MCSLTRHTTAAGAWRAGQSHATGRIYICRTPACHECEPLAVRTPACGFEWRAIPLAGWLSGFEPSHIGCRGVPRGGWVGGKPSLPGAACSALGGSGGAPRVVLLGRGSSFLLPPRKARDTRNRRPKSWGQFCCVRVTLISLAAPVTRHASGSPRRHLSPVWVGPCVVDVPHLPKDS